MPRICNHVNDIRFKMNTIKNKNLRFLIVDDDKYVATSLEAVLDTFHPGCEIDYGANGKDMIDLVSKNEYDAILMENKMPVMDGIKALETIRMSGNQTPAILISRDPTPEYAKNPANRVAYLLKPADIIVLEAEIDKCLNLKK